MILMTQGTTIPKSQYTPAVDFSLRAPEVSSGCEFFFSTNEEAPLTRCRYGTAVEHHSKYEYQFVDTRDIFMGQIQTETA